MVGELFKVCCTNYAFDVSTKGVDQKEIPLMQFRHATSQKGKNATDLIKTFSCGNYTQSNTNQVVNTVQKKTPCIMVKTGKNIGILNSEACSNSNHAVKREGGGKK